MRFALMASVAIGCGPASVVIAQERGTRVVADRPARVFVMAGFDLECRALTPVTISIDRQPEKGSVSMRENQVTTVQYSLSGKCVGSRVSGTGIYYTARPGATGSDMFTISARLGDQMATRTFTVQIADD
jgi:hypothetical protein